jgi:hypothetical protein
MRGDRRVCGCAFLIVCFAPVSASVACAWLRRCKRGQCPPSLATRPRAMRSGFFSTAYKGGRFSGDIRSSLIGDVRRTVHDRLFMPPTTARELVSRLRRGGISQADITAAHVGSCYERLQRTRDAPDFAAIAPLLDSLETCACPPAWPVLGVIVETRCHPNLGRVLKAFLARLKIPLQVVHGKANREFLFASLSADELAAITCCQLPVDDLPASLYNALMLSERFWLSLAGRGKILVFQTDAICCSGSDYQLADFMEFDYIGSLWSRQRPVGIIADGGNGGLSLRDWRASVQCLSRFPPDLWPGGEDGYFAFHMELAGKRVANSRACACFSTHERFLRRSWGIHNPTALSKEEQASLLAYCPEAAILLK